MTSTVSARTKTARRAARIVVLAVVAVTCVAIRPGDASIGDEPLAHLRVTIESTSDWTTAEIAGVGRLLSTRTVTVTPGDKVYRNGGSVTLVGSAPSAVTVDLLVTLTGATGLSLDKGYNGEAAVQIERLSPDQATVASLDNDLHIGANQVTTAPLHADDLTGSGVEIPVLDDRPLTLAFYYPWWPDGSARPSQFKDGPSSAWRTDHPGDVATMVDEAAGAGIDGFVVSWGGERTDGEELDLVLDAAEARGDFQVAVVLELLQFTEKGLFGRTHLNVQAAAKAVRDAMARSDRSPYLTVDGRPVVMVFGIYDIPPADWSRLWAAIAPSEPFVVTEAKVEGSKGVYLYDPTYPSTDELHRRYQALYRSTHLDPIVHPDVPPRLFAATVSPGMGLMLGSPGSHRPREGGARYDRIWQVALNATPDWVLITSWNEWYEGTHVAPSTQYGRLALDQTASWTARFRG